VAGIADLRLRASQQAFQTYLHALDLVDRHIEALERDLDAAAKDGPWRDLVARLRCLRGIDTLTALGLVAEIQGLRRPSARRGDARPRLAGLGLWGTPAAVAPPAACCPDEL
jgi:transposase